MVSTRNTALIKKELINYISSLGLTVKTVTKARGNRGFFKEGRIDISKNLDDKNALKTLIHEFAHYINFKLDNKLKSLSILFSEDNEILREELFEVTKFVDENAQCIILNSEKEKIKQKIKNMTGSIRKVYPHFSLSKKFKEFHNYAKWSNISYLEKYDRVKVQSWFSHKIYSISNVKKDFPDIPEVFVTYLTLKSQQRRRAKISGRINKLKKYYSEPCELFARFVEGLYLDSEKVKKLAPKSYKNFIDLYNKNYYTGMHEMFSILGIVLI